jgi:hypothetical protein
MSIHHPYQRKNTLEVYDDIWMVKFQFKKKIFSAIFF